MKKRLEASAVTSRSLVSLVAAVLVFAAACGGSAPPETSPAASGHASAFPASTGSNSSPAAAGLRPGDAVKIEIWREPDLSGEFQVTQRGVVVFPLLGEREVAGVSAEELEGRLVAEYREYLENPSVSVTVLRRVSILGEVREPGLYPVDPTMTLTEVLALAGGVAPAGNKNDIRLIRDGQVLRQSVDAATTLDATPIRSGDQVVVGQRSWFSRNLPIVTAGIGAVTSVMVALILR